MKRIVIGYLLVFIAITNSPAQGRGVDAESTSQVHLLQAAVGASDIQALGSPSFRLNATVDIISPAGNTIRGSYELLWVSGNKWREEIIFPSYRRLRVGDANSYWQVRTTNFEIPRVFELMGALDFVPGIVANEQEAGGRIKEEKIKGRVNHCVEFHPADVAKRKFCFDVATGVLMSNKEGGGVNDITRQGIQRLRAFRREAVSAHAEGIFW